MTDKPASYGAAVNEKQRISALLRAHGITPTAQRVRVGQVLFARDQHLTADEVLTQLRDGGARVSKATVYNTLNLFASKGLVRELNLDASRSSFDSNTSPHFHFRVEGTGELIDVPPDEIEFSRLPALPAGTEAAGVEVVIRVRRRA